MLLAPTFNGRPIRANSSEEIDRYGVVAERVEAYRNDLADEAVARIEELAGDLYERARVASLAR